MVDANPFLLIGPDFYNFLLPWIFTFAVVYGLVTKIDALKEKGVAIAISLVVAFFVTAVGGPQMAAFFTGLFGGASVFLAGILVILLFTTLAGVGWKKDQQGGAMLVLAALVLLGIFLFLASTGTSLGVVISSSTATLIFWGAVIAAAIYLVAYK